MINRPLLSLFIALSMCSAVVAHGPKHGPTASTDETVADVEGGHLELVLTPTELHILVSDQDGKPLAAAGLVARAIIQDGTKQIVLPLSPKEPNMLVASLPTPLAKGAKVAISTTLAKDAKPVQARFVVK